MTDRDKSMYALGMIRMAKIVIAATRQINIKYFSTFAKIDTDTSKDDIVLRFPKEQNGVFLKDFSQRHSLGSNCMKG